MSNGKENQYFSSDINDRERACFEIGIKLGALYHILCGIPISSDPQVIESIEQGIEASISCQPYVKSVKINICLLYTSPSPRDRTRSRMPSSA